MIQVRSLLQVADNSGAKQIRVIQVHGGSKRRFGYVGDVVTASVVKADPNGTVKKGEKVKAVVVRTRKEFKRAGGEFVRFGDNAAVVITAMENLDPIGTRVFGPVAREVKNNGFTKIANLAAEVL
ncbi:MAG: 50S ribosomal protein L14 [bacterium]|nr:50S ribosomal protein L14 [bacterium]